MKYEQIQKYYNNKNELSFECKVAIEDFLALFEPSALLLDECNIEFQENNRE